MLWINDLEICIISATASGVRRLCASKVLRTVLELTLSARIAKAIKQYKFKVHRKLRRELRSRRHLVIGYLTILVPQLARQNLPILLRPDVIALLDQPWKAQQYTGSTCREAGRRTERQISIICETLGKFCAYCFSTDVLGHTQEQFYCGTFRDISEKEFKLVIRVIAL